jgi:hypothetical protein
MGNMRFDPGAVITCDVNIQSVICALKDMLPLLEKAPIPK